MTLEDVIKSDQTLNYFINEAKIDWHSGFQINIRCAALSIALHKYLEKKYPTPNPKLYHWTGRGWYNMEGYIQFIKDEEANRCYRIMNEAQYKMCFCNQG